ncbi:MAG: deoxyribonuclease V [Acidobacteriota bacterium]|nr:deoxyribonuclease V [Acidobacteriota bacterium]
MSLPHIPVPRRDPSGGWDLGEAKTLQRRLRDRVERRDRLDRVGRIAGADVSYDRGGATLYAAVVVLDAGSLETIETATAIGRARFPYIPGYLSFRESPAVVAAFARLRRRPDLLMVDGHGLAHPRSFGIASHLGVLLDVPTIGVAKSVLVGEAGEPGVERGATAPLVFRGKRAAVVVRTRTGVSPVYVSIGHRVSLRTAVRWVLGAGTGYRIPEPTRRAHLEVNRLRARRNAS